MTEFANKSFSVYPGKDGGQQYRDNWDRIYGKKEEKPDPHTEAELYDCGGCDVCDRMFGHLRKTTPDP